MTEVTAINNVAFYCKEKCGGAGLSCHILADGDSPVMETLEHDTVKLGACQDELQTYLWSQMLM
jgi:hypothetical protein